VTDHSRIPPIVAYVPDLMDRSRISAARPDVVFVRAPADLSSTPARLVLLDAGRPGALEAVATIEAPVIAFGAHVDDELLDAARRAGCAEVLPRSRFFRRLAELT
jgi:hypothetical protein